MRETLPAVPSLELIRKRLARIFPEGVEHRTYVTRAIAAKTVFVMCYAGAREGTDRWIRPDQVTKMTNRQAGKTDDTSRERWMRDSLSPGKMRVVPGRWYAVNTRESIRDETLRMGLVHLGAVVERRGVPTTSARPRYALQRDFALLFRVDLSEREFRRVAGEWQQRYLSAPGLARIRLRERGALAGGRSMRVLVTLPSGETRTMAPGPSSVVTKAVVEDFAVRFLIEPAIVLISEPGNKIIAEDDKVARSLGLEITRMGLSRERGEKPFFRWRGRRGSRRGGQPSSRHSRTRQRRPTRDSAGNWRGDRWPGFAQSPITLHSSLTRRSSSTGSSCPFRSPRPNFLPRSGSRRAP